VLSEGVRKAKGSRIQGFKGSSGKKQKSEDRSQKTEGRRQKVRGLAKNRRQKSENRRQKVGRLEGWRVC